jgi:P2-related tail formation protein
MKIKQEEFINHLYNLLPSIYRDEDKKQGQPFYRYLTVTVKGGYGKAIDDINNFLYLVDPEKCPDPVFPTLYESFGLEYFEDIDVKYHRKFLSNIGGMIKRRGTYASLRYLIRVITGLEIDLIYERVYNEGRTATVSRDLYITLLANSIDQVNELDTSVAIVEAFIKKHVPFYITTHITTSVQTQVIKRGVYRKSAMTQFYKYNLIP